MVKFAFFTFAFFIPNEPWPVILRNTISPGARPQDPHFLHPPTESIQMPRVWQGIPQEVCYDQTQIHSRQQGLHAAEVPVLRCHGIS